jgi:hypothetical protein
MSHQQGKRRRRGKRAEKQRQKKAEQRKNRAAGQAQQASRSKDKAAPSLMAETKGSGSDAGADPPTSHGSETEAMPPAPHKKPSLLMHLMVGLVYMAIGCSYHTPGEPGEHAKHPSKMIGCAYYTMGIAYLVVVISERGFKRKRPKGGSS